MVDGYDDSTYGESFADVYDEWYHDVTDASATVELLRGLGGDGDYLELGVGTGRIAVPLAATGARVTGVDSSPAMIERLATKASSAGVRVEAHLGDMVDDLPTGPFDVVYVTFNTLFNVCDADRQRRVFSEVARRLRPGGRFVVEAFVPDPQRPAGGTVGVRTMAVDRVVLVADVHHPDRQTVDGQIIEITESGGVRLRPFSIRYCPVEELDSMARSAGLALMERTEGPGGPPFDGGSSSHVSIWGPQTPPPATPTRILREP